jgi:hypothetical protein
MVKKLGGTRKHWEKVISTFQKRKRYNDPDTAMNKTQEILNELGIGRIKGKILSDTRKQINDNFNKIDNDVNKTISEIKYEEYYKNVENDQSNSSNEQEKEKKSIRDNIEKKTIQDIKNYLEKGYLRRLKNKDKSGIVNASFITSHEGFFKKDEKQLKDFLLELTPEEFLNLYTQSNKIAGWEEIKPVDIIEIDKHFTKIFDKEKIKQALPMMGGYGFIDLWFETIGLSIAIMKKYYSDNPREKQLDNLGSVVLYRVLKMFSGYFIEDMLYREFSELRKTNKMPKSDEEFDKFTDYFNKKYQDHLIVYKNKFMDIFDIKEKTFYRRQKNIRAFNKSLVKKIDGKKRIDWYDTYKLTKTKNAFGIKEPLNN